MENGSVRNDEDENTGMGHKANNRLMNQKDKHRNRSIFQYFVIMIVLFCYVIVDYTMILQILDSMKHNMVVYKYLNNR